MIESSSDFLYTATGQHEGHHLIEQTKKHELFIFMVSRDFGDPRRWFISADCMQFFSSVVPCGRNTFFRFVGTLCCHRFS